ncbi:hypothetical protein BC835DRAFT_1308110 [Cytidiella melzeri]|nr:hypothetical protein BC835DRAFT_1308110 [Cytidiella melzeri]
MDNTTDTTFAPLDASGDVMSQLQSLTLKEDAKHDLARVVDFIDAPAIMKEKGTTPFDEPESTPSNLIPGLRTLGSTYDVLRGQYADSLSTKQQVIDWDKTEFHPQEFGGKTYNVSEAVNFNYNTKGNYYSSSGTTATEYIMELSSHADLGVGFRGFSASASVDFTKSQLQNLSHAFTRVTHEATHYSLSLIPPTEIRPLLKSWFVNDLENMEPLDLYQKYGTHLLNSLTIGGRALFLTATDTRSYSSEISFSVAAKISASYKLADGHMELSVEERAAMNSFNASSEFSITTKGGDPKYGNEEFLKNVEAWAGSIIDYPEFVDFGSFPCLIGLWDFASTPDRCNVLREAYKTYVATYTPDLGITGPYIWARISYDLPERKNAYAAVSNGWITYKFPDYNDDGWYFITPGLGGRGAIIAKELVPGALAKVKWQEIFVAPARDIAIIQPPCTRFWRAISPSSDYVAMGVVAVSAIAASQLPSEPPAALADHFRALHRSAVIPALTGVSRTFTFESRYFFAIDDIYWFAGKQLPPQAECFRMGPHKQMVILEGDDW